jgi:hypothetical protein
MHALPELVGVTVLGIMVLGLLVFFDPHMGNLWRRRRRD